MIFVDDPLVMASSYFLARLFLLTMKNNIFILTFDPFNQNYNFMLSDFFYY